MMAIYAVVGCAVIVGGLYVWARVTARKETIPQLGRLSDLSRKRLHNSIQSRRRNGAA